MTAAELVFVVVVVGRGEVGEERAEKYWLAGVCGTVLLDVVGMCNTLLQISFVHGMIP